MLDGCRVLLVEDEAIVAAQLSELIESAGGRVVGPVASVAEAKRMMPTLWADAAVLDLNVADGEITPVLEALIARGLPVVVYTGGSLPEAVHRRHPNVVVLRKPVHPARIVAEVRRARLAGSQASA